MAPSINKAHLGQITEYLPGRIYLAAYITPPNASTYFPFAPSAPRAPSPSKRSRQASHAEPQPAPAAAASSPCYFSIDDTLLYNAFHHDFGPLHIGHLYRFALEFHEILGLKENEDRPIVFWSRADSRSRANAAAVLACYMVLVQNWPPHLALAPIAQMDPPLMPFRDAGYSQADYGITVQDVVYGVWKAREEGCCALDNFDLDEYEKYERVENGDFNWITPHFVAFASPQHTPVSRITEASDLHRFLPRDVDAVDEHPTLPTPFKNVLRHFSDRNVGLVVRLNSHLYSPSYFEALGIQHVDMIFDDGTCPTLSSVRKFIRLAHETITVRKQGIAVHCKAGLGRTGCLIGAYLIYRHGFTANEVIAFMRFMRPGMVVGPQQHWLHLNQGTFREWWVEERVERRLRKEMAAAAAAAATASGSTSSLVNAPSIPRTGKSGSMRGGANHHAHHHHASSTNSVTMAGTGDALAATPPRRSASNRSPLGEVDHDRGNIGVQEDYLPAPTPGQPRKTARTHHANGGGGERRDHHGRPRDGVDDGIGVGGGGGGVAAKSSLDAASPKRRSRVEDPLEDEERTLRARAARRAASQSPERRAAEKRRSASHHASTATAVAAAAVYHHLDPESAYDVENLGSPTRAKTTTTTTTTVTATSTTTAAGGGAPPGVVGGGAAPNIMTKVRSGKRHHHHADSSPLKAKDAGVRKTSGRIGSIGTGPSQSPARKASAA
jgi:cell division cycle 14